VAALGELPGSFAAGEPTTNDLYGFAHPCPMYRADNMVDHRKTRESLVKRERRGPMRVLTHEKIVASQASFRTARSERFRHRDRIFATCNELFHWE
jgi:hypothetical protein